MGLTRILAAVVAVGLIGSATPAVAAEGSVAEGGVTDGTVTASPSAPTSPYGNPFNDYLRRPYGVMDSPEQQKSLAPVDDRADEPFDWYRHPRAVIGPYGGPEEAVITPEGYLQTQLGTLRFDTGADRTAVDQRVKTWRDGWLPILSEAFQRDGIDHTITFFSAKVDGVAKVPYAQRYAVPTRTLDVQADNFVTFVDVTLKNTTHSPTTARFGATLTPDGVQQDQPQPGPSWPASPVWDARTASLGGDGKLLLTASGQPTEAANRLGWSTTLAPGASTTIRLRMPYWVARSRDLGKISGADHDRVLASTDAFWRKTLRDASTDIALPAGESKMIDTYRAAIVQSLISTDLVGGHCFWDGNPTVYDKYYLRDAAFDIDGMLGAGFTDLARLCTRDMLLWQNDTGQFISKDGENDGNGQALAMFGNYLNRTGDKAFAAEVLPAVRKAMAWEWQQRQDDWPVSGGLFPTSSMEDNEGVAGHVLTYDLWNIAGERGAAAIARAAGDPATADSWARRADQYEAILRAKLKPAVDRIGWIPPTLEGLDGKALRTGWYGDTYGLDWGNLEVVSPTGVFEPNEEWVTKSLESWRDKMFEGVFTYPMGGIEGLLHSYTPMSILDTDIRRGDQTEALKGLYDLLVHTSATHSAGEGLNAAQRWDWSEDGQTQPHNEFAGKYLTLVRDMMAYEGQDGRLYLANTWNPDWAQPGRRIAFSGDTDLGPVSFSITSRAGGATAHLVPPSSAPVVLRVPAGATVTSAQLHGRGKAVVNDGTIVLTGLSGPVDLTINWRLASAAPVSYDRAVQDYKANYARLTSPVNVRITDLKAVSGTVSATVVNDGGAGYLPDPAVSLWVDGQVVARDTRSFARGIGFTTPPGVTSFARNAGGVIPVGFTLTAPGAHTVGIGFGDTPPTRTIQVTG
jgi:hypothetical protein